jgi:hypothetical protein
VMRSRARHFSEGPVSKIDKVAHRCGDAGVATRNLKMRWYGPSAKTVAAHPQPWRGCCRRFAWVPK